MNFSAGKARRKWPCGGSGRTAAAMVSAGVLLAALGVPSGPALAKRPAPWSQGPWSDLFGPHRPKLRRAALPAHTKWLKMRGWGHVPMWIDPAGVSQVILEGTLGVNT